MNPELEKILATFDEVAREAYEEQVAELSRLGAPTPEDLLDAATTIAADQQSRLAGGATSTAGKEPSPKEKLLLFLDEVDTPADVKDKFKALVRAQFAGISNDKAEQAVVDRLTVLRAGGKSPILDMLSQANTLIEGARTEKAATAFDKYYKTNILDPYQRLIDTSGAGIVQTTYKGIKAALQADQEIARGKYMEWRAKRLAADPTMRDRIDVEGPALFMKETKADTTKVISPMASSGLPGLTADAATATSRTIDDSVEVAKAAANRVEQLREMLTSYIQQARNAAGVSPDVEAGQSFNRLATAIEASQTRIINEYEQGAAIGIDPDDFLNDKLTRALRLNLMGSGFENLIVQGDAVGSLTGIFAGIAAKGAANVKGKADKAALDAQEKAQKLSSENIAKTSEAIRGQFKDRPDLGAQAESAWRNALIQDPNADPNTFVKQFQGQAEGTARITQRLIDSGLDMSKLPPDLAKVVMERGITMDTLPSLVANLPAFKTKYPSVSPDGKDVGTTIAKDLVDKALKEQPGNPMISIQAQLQPSPANPNAQITPAYADAIGKQAQEIGVSSTALAKAHAGDPTAILAEQNMKANSRASAFTGLGAKFGITQQQINEAVLKRQFGEADVKSGKYKAYLSALNDGSVADVDSHYVGTLFQSNQVDPYDIIGGLVPQEFQQAYKGIPRDAKSDQITKYASMFPDPETEEEKLKKLQATARQTTSAPTPRRPY